MITHTFALFRRFWPQLACLYLLERALHPFMLRASVEIGFRNHLLGLSALALIVLVKLIVLVWMFHLLRPGLPHLAAPSQSGAGDAPPSFTSVLSLVLVPFFAYYAAWGFLGDAVRDYSLLGLTLDPFGEHGPLLVAGDSQWLLLIVAASWLLLKICNDQMRRRGAFGWRLAATLLSANWVFIGLYALGAYWQEITAWFAQYPLVDEILRIKAAMQAQLPSITLPGIPASLATILSFLRDMFFYVLLPLVWLALAALIYNRKMEATARGSASRFAKVEMRYNTLPPLVRKILDRLIGGYRTRYLPIARSVELTLTSGLGFLLLFIFSYRLITWGSVWLWIGVKELIGPYSRDIFYVLADVMGIVIGNPLGPERGILFEPLRICLLAAALDRAVAAHRKYKSSVVTPPDAGNANIVAAH